jgi:hypothetical protein
MFGGLQKVAQHENGSFLEENFYKIGVFLPML